MDEKTDIRLEAWSPQSVIGNWVITPSGEVVTIASYYWNEYGDLVYRVHPQ